MSQGAFEKFPRLDKICIKRKVQEDLHQAVQYAQVQQVPHWTIDHHEHRQESTRIIHEAMECVAATKVKPRKLYVTDAILEVSAHITRLIKTKHRDEQHVKLLDGKRVFAV